MMNDESADQAGRPLGVYLAALWSWIRAIRIIGWWNLLIVFDLFSAYNAESFKYQVSNLFQHFFSNAASSLSVLFTLIFLLTGIGLFLGKRWGRTGFLAASVGMILWNIEQIFYLKAVMGESFRFSFSFLQIYSFLRGPLYSCAAFLLAYWLLRQPDVLRFFKLEIKVSPVLERRVFNAPLDLAVSLGIVCLLFLIDVPLSIFGFLLARGG